jgi:hypothetical protein
MSLKPTMALICLAGYHLLFSSQLSFAADMPLHVACNRYTLKTLAKYEEVGSGFKLECTKIFGKRVCTKIPTVIHRGCALEAFANICFPADIGNAIPTCLASAGLLSAISAVVSDGSAAGPTFTESLKLCLATEGLKDANEVSANVGVGKTCGPWH